MKKQELLKMRPLRATKIIKELSANDKPRHKEGYGKDLLVYKYGLYLRCHIDNGILKTAVFLADHLRAGAYNPAYEIFVDKKAEKFITYDRLRDRWLDAKLDKIDFPFHIQISDEKWISRSDDKIIRKYLGAEKSGYNGLLEYQRKIREKELLARHKLITDVWDDDLKQIPPLPKDWERWVSKTGIRDNYIFYKYHRKGVTAGYCTFCEKDVPIKKPRYNAQGTCVRCRHKIIFKSVGKAGFVVTERNNMYLMQRCKDGFVIRQFWARRIYRKGKYTAPESGFHEIRRSIYDNAGKAMRAYFWGRFKLRYLRWIPSSLCSPAYWCEEGMIYGKTISDLAKNELSRSGLPEMIKHNRMTDPEKYLAVFKEIPQIEKFAKANLPRIVYECLGSYYGFDKKVHNIEATSLTEMLGVNNQELKRLRSNNGGLRYLEWLRFEKATGRIIQDDAIKWFCSKKIMPDDIQFILNRMSIVQVYNYIRRQASVYKDSPENVITKWADYLSMAKRLKMDVNDEIIFKVNKLYERHDQLVERGNSEKTIVIRAGKILEDYPHIDEICESVKEKYEYADSEYTVLAPVCIEDIINEGNNLHHCMANSDRYWERIERRETYIMFLRKSSDVNKSYYTLEIEPNGTVRQKRTMYDRQEADIEDAKEFLKKWQTVISKRLTAEDKKLSEKSRELRIQSYAQLREDRVIINTGELRGQLLVDVLMADLMENAA